MKDRLHIYLFWWVTPLLLSAFLILFAFSPAANAVSTVYQQQQPHADGIGKVYMGREIAQMMGHTGAGWLERPSRSWEEQPQQLIAALELQPTDVVADLGAGTGYFSFRIAALVPQGRVLAVDVQPEMLEIMNFLKQQAIASDPSAQTNLETVLANPDDPHLPVAGVDLVLMVDAYHEFEYPREVMAKVVNALKPAGRVMLVEYRGENPFIAIKALHKMTQRQVRKEMTVVGLRWVKTERVLPQQHLMVFEKAIANSVSN